MADGHCDENHHVGIITVKRDNTYVEILYTESDRWIETMRKQESPVIADKPAQCFQLPILHYERVCVFSRIIID